MPLAQQWCISGLWYYRPLIGNPILEVRPTGQFGQMAVWPLEVAEQQAIAGAASETFARWLHHEYAQLNCLGHILLLCDTLLFCAVE